MKPALFLALGLCAFLSACTFQSGHTQYKVTPLKKAPALNNAVALYLMMPRDFRKGDKVEKGTGLIVQQTLQEALSACQGARILAAFPQDRQQAGEAAAHNGCAYLLELEILDWYDPPAMLAEAPDRGEVNISLYNTESFQMLRSDNLTCNGSAMLIDYIGSYSPKDCLKAAFTAWEKEVFGGP